jgi:hypothetical protein
MNRRSELVNELARLAPEPSPVSHDDHRALFAARVAYARTADQVRAAFADYTRAVVALLKR